MAENALVRDFINSESISIVGKRIHRIWPEFQTDCFIEKAMTNLDTLGLNERLDQVTESLETFLPDSFETAVDILVKSLPPELGDERKDLDGLDLGSENGFIIIALTNYVSRNGLDSLDISMNALLEMTKRFSSEGAIRHFIIAHEKEVLEQYRKWVVDENVHVRRLVSESLRPRLPWTIRLQKFVKDPTPVLEFLEQLKDDPELYVTRSVANNLNDIAKDHPEITYKTCKRWLEENPQRLKTVRHACRTLLKQGHSKTLVLFGFEDPSHIEMTDFTAADSVTMGEDFTFSFTLKTGEKALGKLRVEYGMDFLKKNGKLARKVFKLSESSCDESSRIFEKKHAFREITTRKYYEGVQRVTIIVNGREMGSRPFELKL